MSQRTQRLADQIQRDLAALIRLELKDPRLGMVTISAVKVSPDLGYADVYVTVLGASLDERPDESLSVLNAAAGFLRSELGRSIRTRMTPRLRFTCCVPKRSWSLPTIRLPWKKQKKRWNGTRRKAAAIPISS